MVPIARGPLGELIPLALGEGGDDRAGARRDEERAGGGGAALRSLALPAPLSAARLKRLRFVVFTLAGRSLTHAGRVVLRLSVAADRLVGLVAARTRLSALRARVASGRARSRPPLRPVPFALARKVLFSSGRFPYDARPS